MQVNRSSVTTGKCQNFQYIQNQHRYIIVNHFTVQYCMVQIKIIILK
jgi:hypothetical protein